MGLLKWTLAFFLLAIMTGVFGFGKITEEFAQTPRILCFGFVTAMVMSLVVDLVKRIYASAGWNTKPADEAG